MTKWLSKIPTCDACSRDLNEEEFFYDARTRKNSPGQGRWGCFCHKCFSNWCIGLGTGFGQKYKTGTREKVEG